MILEKKNRRFSFPFSRHVKKITKNMQYLRFVDRNRIDDAICLNKSISPKCLNIDTRLNNYTEKLINVSAPAIESRLHRKGAILPARLHFGP